MGNRPDAQTTAVRSCRRNYVLCCLRRARYFLKQNIFYPLGAPRRWLVALAQDIPAVFHGVTAIARMAYGSPSHHVVVRFAGNKF